MIEGRETLTSTSKLTYAMVGGGKGAFIGDVHRKAIAMDGKAELVAGCFSQSFENTLETGESWGVAKDRLYRTYQDMIEAEADAARPARLHPHRHAQHHPLSRSPSSPSSTAFTSSATSP